MAIDFRKYVDITSGVGGGAAVRERELIGRLFTINPLVPTNQVLEFTDAASVGDYFGFEAEEYYRAVFYFGWVSKNITRPTKISYARWAQDAAPPRIYGGQAAVLASFNAVANGSVVVSIAGVSLAVTSVNLTAAASLAAVAAQLQTAIRLGVGTQFTAATVAYDATLRRFTLTGGVAEDATIEVTSAGVGTNLIPLLAWGDTSIVSPGADATTIADTLSASADLSNNFGSFAFVDGLSVDERLEAATWAQGQNVRYMFMCRAEDQTDAEDLFDVVQNVGATGVTLAGLPPEQPLQYDEMLPMMVLAATDYTKTNSVTNYMFQRANLTPKVTQTSVSAALDAIRCNYYGRTQTAGQFIDFYQRGTLMGLPTDPVDMNVFANEIWLKDAAGAAVMSLLLSVSRVPANATGRSQLITVLQGVINRALNNGTISVGKTLNDTQKLYITELSGSTRAWQQVATIGYWLDCVMQSYVTGTGATEWKAVYTLIYSKDDAVRKVEGSHVLI